MAALNVDQYKKQLASAIDRWSKKMDACADELDEIHTELSELEDIEEPGEDDKKWIKELKAAREKVRKNIEAAGLSLRVDLMFIQPPEKTKLNEKEFLKLPGFIGDLVKKKGIPLGQTGVVLTPNVDFDFKAGKLKGFELTLKLDW